MGSSHYQAAAAAELWLRSGSWKAKYHEAGLNSKWNLWQCFAAGKGYGPVARPLSRKRKFEVNVWVRSTTVAFALGLHRKQMESGGADGTRVKCEKLEYDIQI